METRSRRPISSKFSAARRITLESFAHSGPTRPQQFPRHAEPMIETRTYEGDASQIAEFAAHVWQGTYAGKMMLPLWDARYFDWQLLAERPGGRDFLVAAYDGTKLVGSLLGEKFRFRLHDQEFDATMGSWLTVDPEYRRQGVGVKLFDETAPPASGARCEVSSRLRLYRTDEHGSQVLEKLSGQHRGLGACRLLGTHVRSAFGVALGPDAARSAGVQDSGHVPEPASAPALTGVYRRYRPEDLADCLGLAHRLLERVDLGYVWSASDWRTSWPAATCRARWWPSATVGSSVS